MILTQALEDPSLGNSKISILNLFAQWIYGGAIVTIFIISMGNRPQGAKSKYMTCICVFALLSVYMVAAAAICTVYAVKNFTDNTLFAQMIISMVSTYGIWIAASVIACDPWHIMTCMLQYLLLAASYTNLLNVYAFSNIQDLSWGTKGDTGVDKKLDVAKADKELGQTVVTDVIADQRDIDNTYMSALSNLKYRKQVPKSTRSAGEKEQEQKDYYANIRTDVSISYPVHHLAPTHQSGRCFLLGYYQMSVPCFTSTS